MVSAGASSEKPILTPSGKPSGCLYAASPAVYYLPMSETQKPKPKDAERVKETEPRPTGHRDGVAVLVPWQVLPLARVVELAL